MRSKLINRFKNIEIYLITNLLLAAGMELFFTIRLVHIFSMKKSTKVI